MVSHKPKTGNVLKHFLTLTLVLTVTQVTASDGNFVPVDLCKLADRSGNMTFRKDAKTKSEIMDTKGPFYGRIDLKELGIDPKQFDLMKLKVKTGRGAFLRLSIENYPNEGELSHWYILDSMRGPTDGWQTLWVDLKRPEEVKLPGRYKGMAGKDPSLKGLQIKGSLNDTRRSIHEKNDDFMIKDLCFIRKSIDLDWDQRNAPYTWGKGEDLIYTYPLTVKNLTGKPVEAALSLVPFQVKKGKAELSVDKVQLKPGETKTVQAKVSLPASVAAQQKPLYCERFAVFAKVDAIPESQVTILRSADPIHLPVVVPIPEDQLKYPMQGRRKGLPDYVLSFDKQLAMKNADAFSPEDIAIAVRDEGGVEGEGGLRKKSGGKKGKKGDKNKKGKRGPAPIVHGARFNAGVNSAAFLYDMTGDRKYLKKTRDALMKMAEVYQQERKKIYSREFNTISEGILARNNLQYCFKFGGTQRPPYLYGGTNGNAAGGRCAGMMNSFDLVAKDLDPKDRQFIIDNLVLPSAIQARNHYIGPGNQQCTSDYVIMYGGIAARNWPLAAFAYSSEHGVLNNMKWGFDDDGLCLEGHYQAYTISPLLWSLELLYHCGIDKYQQRFFDILHSKGAEAINMEYNYPIKRYIDEKRFAGKDFADAAKAAKTDGYHLKGSTLLKWKGLETSMNWGTHIMRSSHDRCALWVRPSDRRNTKLRGLSLGGGSYNHSSFGQSIIILDDSLQKPVPADVLAYDVEGPVQFVMAESDKHYPGSVINRTFALLGQNVLVLDKIVNDKPRTVDWSLKDAGNKVSVPLTEKQGSWTDKKYDNRAGVYYGGEVSSYQTGTTDKDWTEGNGRLTMVGEPGTEIMVFPLGPRKGLMARRKKVKQTDFVTFISQNTKSIEKIPVKKKDGKTANAIGVKVTLKGGKTFYAVTNYEAKGTEVQAGPLKTTARFATDFKE